MLVVFLGPPGSGKGTQARIINKNFGVPVISIGDLLRETAKEKTERGLVLSSLLARGQFAPDEVVGPMVVEGIKRYEGKPFVILDGFPRTANQAEMLREFESQLAVIYFELDPSYLADRISFRYSCSDCGEIYNARSASAPKDGICSKCGSTKFDYRSDDNLETLIKRLKQYNTQTVDLLRKYEALKILYKINAAQSVNEVTREIVDILTLR